MMLPPLWMKIRVVEGGKNKLRLWFPLVLVWLVLLALAIVLSPIILLASLILWRNGIGKKLLMFGPMFFCLLGTLHGLNIQTESIDNQFIISFR
jgi:hypothetical protein